MPWIDSSVSDAFFPHDYPTLIQEAPKKPTIAGTEYSDGILFALAATVNSLSNAYYLPASAYGPNSTFGPANISNTVNALFDTQAQLGDKSTAQLQANITNFYTSPDNSSVYSGSAFYIEKYAQIFSDMWFIIPVLVEAQLKLQAGWNNLYLYRQVYVNPAALASNPLNPVIESLHGNVVFNTFLPGYIPAANFTSNDTAMINFWVNTMVNFIKTGEPTTDNSWQPASAALPSKSLQVTMPSPHMVDSMVSDRMSFWQGIFAQYPSYNVMRGSP